MVRLPRVAGIYKALSKREVVDDTTWGRIPVTLGGRLAGRAAAHLPPGLEHTGLAADVGVDELRVVHLTHDAVL